MADLIRMKLVNFRLSHRTHLKDLDEAGLITAEIESGLTALLRQRLTGVRASG